VKKLLSISSLYSKKNSARGLRKGMGGGEREGYLDRLGWAWQGAWQFNGKQS